MASSNEDVVVTLRLANVQRFIADVRSGGAQLMICLGRLVQRRGRRILRRVLVAGLVFLR